MSDFLKNKQENKDAKEPIFLERGDGLGWTINFNRPISYVLLILFLVIVVVFCLFAAGSIKL